MPAHRLACVAMSLLAGLLLAAGTIGLVGASPATAPEWRGDSEPVGAPSADPSISCGPNITHTRPVDLWYGSTFVAGTALTDVIELSDHVTPGGAGAIFSSYSDPRVKNGIGVWLTSTTDMTWTQSAGENLPAEANLRTRLGSIALAPPYHAVRFDQVVGHGTLTYTLASWQVDEGGCTRTHVGAAAVSYFELNAHAVQLVYLPLTRR